MMKLFNFTALQSTLPHGERPPKVAGWYWYQLASIHAPARGATQGAPHPWAVCVSFNPRSRTGSDRNCSHRGQRVTLLQSTLPHGERQTAPFPILSPDMLQSTLPHGERRFIRPLAGCADKLQSTLPHGERPSSSTHESSPLCASIHAPARGATAGRYSTAPLTNTLQSTLPHGERLGHGTCNR